MVVEVGEEGGDGGKVARGGLDGLGVGVTGPVRSKHGIDLVSCKERIL